MKPGQNEEFVLQELARLFGFKNVGQLNQFILSAKRQASATVNVPPTSAPPTTITTGQAASSSDIKSIINSIFKTGVSSGAPFFQRFVRRNRIPYNEFLDVRSAEILLRRLRVETQLQKNMDGRDVQLLETIRDVDDRMKENDTRWGLWTLQKGESSDIPKRCKKERVSVKSDKVFKSLKGSYPVDRICKSNHL